MSDYIEFRVAVKLSTVVNVAVSAGHNFNREGVIEQLTTQLENGLRLDDMIDSIELFEAQIDGKGLAITIAL